MEHPKDAEEDKDDQRRGWSPPRQQRQKMERVIIPVGRVPYDIYSMVQLARRRQTLLEEQFATTSYLPSRIHGIHHQQCLVKILCLFTMSSDKTQISFQFFCLIR